jgi:hypothetical protein
MELRAGFSTVPSDFGESLAFISFQGVILVSFSSRVCEATRRERL